MNSTLCIKQVVNNNLITCNNNSSIINGAEDRALLTLHAINQGEVFGWQQKDGAVF